MCGYAARRPLANFPSESDSFPLEKFLLRNAPTNWSASQRLAFAVGKSALFFQKADGL
jgi:hypothetical protein